MIQHSGLPRFAVTAANRSARCGVALTGALAQSTALVVAGRGFFFAVSACPAGVATGKAGERMAPVVKGDEHGCAPAAGEAVGAFLWGVIGSGAEQSCQSALGAAGFNSPTLLQWFVLAHAPAVARKSMPASFSAFPTVEDGPGSARGAGSIPARASSLSRLETGRSTARPRGGASVVGSIPTIRAESKSAASGNRRTELVRYSSDGGERPAPHSGRP